MRHCKVSFTLSFECFSSTFSQNQASLWGLPAVFHLQNHTVMVKSKATHSAHSCLRWNTNARGGTFWKWRSAVRALVQLYYRIWGDTTHASWYGCAIIEVMMSAGLWGTSPSVWLSCRTQAAASSHSPCRKHWVKKTNRSCTELSFSRPKGCMITRFLRCVSLQRGHPESSSTPDTKYALNTAHNTSQGTSHKYVN